MTDDVLERLKEFEKHQLEMGDEYGAEVLYHAIAEIERLRGHVNDLQSGMYINCVYCGHRYGPDPGTPVAMADVLKAHIEECPKHPLLHAKAEIERLRKEVKKEGRFFCHRCGHYSFLSLVPGSERNRREQKNSD